MDEELKALLTENNLQDYIELLEKEKILNISDLKELTKDDFKELGISALGDRKKFLKIMRGDSKTENEMSTTVAIVESVDEEPFIDTAINGKCFCYKNSDPNHLYCRKCHSSVSEYDTRCWNCNERLSEDNYYPASKNGYDSRTETPESIIINNNSGDSGNAAHTGLAGVLGGIIGAVAVIVIILIILSNESWAL